MARILLLFFCCLIFACVYAQDSIKVVFIYGSKPAHGFESTEPRWFGGIRGGHTAIQIGADRVFSFRSTEYPCHIFSKHKKEKLASVWEYKTVERSWQTFPPHRYNIDSLQRAEVVIPINAAQRTRLDCIAAAYTADVPYDYAVFGIRCASATYDVLQQIGITPMHKHGNWLRIFTVRALRKRLFKAAKLKQNEGWAMRIYKGGKSRKWEKDF